MLRSPADGLAGDDADQCRAVRLYVQHGNGFADVSFSQLPLWRDEGTDQRVPGVSGGMSVMGLDEKERELLLMNKRVGGIIMF